MNWFSGNIAEAVATSKQKNAIFVVYCEGTDETSTAFTSLINDERIRGKLESDDFVAIKVQSESEAYIQFAQIYKLVPLPSLFFIGKTGAPLDIVTGITTTVDELEGKLNGVLAKVRPSPPAPQANPSASSAPAGGVQEAQPDNDTEVVCENGVCYKRPKQNAPAEGTSEQSGSGSTAGTADTAESDAAEPANEEKLLRARELIAKKRKDKEDEDALLAKERELQRRRCGQDLQNFKQRQEENEMKKLQEERKRDKIEEQAARKRILEQIAQDKAERAQRFNLSATTAQSKPSSNRDDSVSVPPPSVISNATETRIQFKKPDGETDVRTFGRDEPFINVRTYVEENVIVGSGIREFALATTFPRREFQTDDNAKTLFDLGLVPSSVILVLPLDKAPSRRLPLQNSYGMVAMLTTAFWSILSPVFSAFTYLRNLVFARNRAQTGSAKRASEEELNHNEQAKKRVLRFPNQQAAVDPTPQSGPSRRIGGRSSNIHRLSDTKDSDDENNTWNGNSTQQQ